MSLDAAPDFADAIGDASCAGTPARRARRVVLTGLGIITGNAGDVASFQRTLTEGTSALGPLRTGPAKDWACAFGAQVDEARFERAQAAMSGSRDFGLALHAANQSVQASGLAASARAASALVVGCVLYPQRNRMAEVLGAELGLGLRRYVVDAACSSGAHALALGFDLVRRGKVPAAVIVSHNTLLYKDVAGLFKLGILTREAVRPFDRRRTGTQPGEGAGAVVVEDYDHAMARGAPIVAEIVGIGLGADASGIVPPHLGGLGLSLAMQRSLHSAGIAPSQVDYINAHGTGTKLNDPSEAAAIHAAIGPRARHVAVSSTKPIHGHTLGAAGLVEAIVTALAVQHDFMPPTLNHEEPDPRCELDQVAGRARFAPVRVALSNSSGFGGLYSCVAFRKATASAMRTDREACVAL
jgi:nodulation protein E